MLSAVAHVFVFTTCHLSVILVQPSGTKKTQSAAGASFCLPILELSCSYLSGQRLNCWPSLSSPPPPPPTHTHTHTHTLLPSPAKALSTESPYLHGLDFFHAEERNLVHSRSPRSGPHRQSGHVIHRRTMTILWGSERGGGWREAPRFWPELERRSRPPPTPFPFRPQQSPALVPLGSRGKTPSALLTRANKACPLWTRWRCQKLLGWWVEGGVGGW